MSCPRIPSEHPTRIDLFALIEKIAFDETDLIGVASRVRIDRSNFHLNQFEKVSAFCPKGQFTCSRVSLALDVGS